MPGMARQKPFLRVPEKERHMKRNLSGTLGLIILGAGLIVLVYGGYLYYDASQSLGGKISGLFKKLSDDHVRAIYVMAAGFVSASIGFMLSRKR
jgi:hypothetical protein